MTTNKFRIILFLMTIALVGIVSLQISLIKDSYTQKELLFDQTINAVLTDVVKKVEKEEAISFIQKKTTPSKKMIVKKTSPTPNKMEIVEKETSKTVSVNRDIPTRPLSEKRINELAEKKALEISRIRMREAEIQEKKSRNVLDSIRNEGSFSFNFSNENFSISFPEFEFIVDTLKSTNFTRVWSNNIFTSDTSSTVIISKPKRGKAKSSTAVGSIAPKPPSPPASPAPPIVPLIPERLLIKQLNPNRDQIIKEFLATQKKDRVEIFEELAVEMEVQQLPIEKRVHPQVIDSLIKLELNRRGVDLDYSLGISTNQNKNIFHNVSDVQNPNQWDYKICLFEDKNNEENAVISLHFPQKEDRLTSEMGPTLASSSILLLILLGCFIYTIHAILKQKKLSELKNDFINNMTHEFKTPVSTILLASEALKDPEIIKDETRIQRLSGIIYEENQRLSEHVERVLNMARMDKGEIKLVMNHISLHEAISEVCEHIELSLNTRSQKINLELNAKNDHIYADPFHLKNIIQNLIDNASKYSSDHTEINIVTEGSRDEVILRVIDKGIGMKKDQAKKIFEPFYRVPTGNLHDVKGFGIGLHYVHSILKQMGGKISVKTELAQGSEFIVHFSKSII